ncbi:MAG: response regulator [Lentisphaeria bacterium]|nr:response regulator [Lentisphaeria bacterium]
MKKKMMKVMSLLLGKQSSMGLSVIYIVMAVAFLLIVSLNLYAYFNISSLGTEYGEVSTAIKGFRLECREAYNTMKDIVVYKVKDKKESDIWDKLKKAKEYWDQIFKYHPEIRSLGKKSDTERDILEKLSDCVNEIGKKGDAAVSGVSNMEKHLEIAEQALDGIESNLKDRIGNEVVLVRVVYVILILFIIVTFIGIILIIFFGEWIFRKRSQALEGKFTNLNALVQGFDSIIITISNKGVIKSWNLNAERYFDKKAEEAMEANIYEIFPYMSKLKPIFDQAVYSNKRTYRYHELVAVNRGPLRVINILCVPLVSMEYKSGYSELLVKLEDVTSFCLEEDRKILTQKVEAMYALLESVERDSAPMMENISNAMVNVNTIAAECGREDEITAYTSYMRTTLAQIGILPQLYMSAVAGSSVSKTHIDLNEMIMYVLRICQKTFDSRVSIEVSLNESRSWVLANPIRLFYAFLNIVRNAEEAMITMRKEGEEAGGILSVSVEKIPAERVSIDKIVRYRHAFDDEPAYWIVLVSDTGVGLSPEVKANAFDPFFTTKDKMKHKGLGLCTTANIIDELGGHVDINSQVGKGTVFKLFLPESKEAAASEGSVNDSLDFDESLIVKGSGRLLLVIDDPLLNDTMTKLFRKIGYEVISAGNGFEAVSHYVNYGGDFKGVLLDISTKYMTASDTYFQLTSINGDVKIIVAQTSDRDDAVVNLKNAGFTNFIQKPYPIDMLSQKIAEF